MEFTHPDVARVNWDAASQPLSNLRLYNSQTGEFEIPDASFWKIKLPKATGIQVTRHKTHVFELNDHSVFGFFSVLRKGFCYCNQKCAIFKGCPLVCRNGVWQYPLEDEDTEKNQNQSK